MEFDWKGSFSGCLPVGARNFCLPSSTTMNSQFALLPPFAIAGPAQDTFFQSLENFLSLAGTLLIGGGRRGGEMGLYRQPHARYINIVLT
jgi:hypothetical protein